MKFDIAEGDVCPRCVHMSRIWLTDRAEYSRIVEERHERWEERDLARYRADVAADLARQESYGNEPIADDESEY